MLRGNLKKLVIIITIMIVALLLISQFNVSSAASVGQTVSFGGKDLTDNNLKFEGNRIFCVERGVNFNRTGSGKIEKIIDINASSSVQDLAVAYVLSNTDTALNSSAIDSKDIDSLVATGWSKAGAERWLMQGVYRLTSNNQNAIWAIKNGNGMSGTESQFVSNTPWESTAGTSIKYDWDTNGDGRKEDYRLVKNGNYFKFENSNVQDTEIYDRSYYSNGLKLYQEAVEFAKNYNSTYIKNNTTGTPEQDYSDSDYIFIGPYTISVFSEITGVTFKDQDNRTINSSNIGIFTKNILSFSKINPRGWNGGTFYIGLKKSATDVSQIKTVTFTSEKETVSGKIYYISCGIAQNLVCGDVDLKEESKNFEITINQEIVPPKIEKLTIKKSDIQGDFVSGAKFNITLSNIESIGKYSSGSTSGKIILSNATTDSSGNIVLEELEVADINSNITIEIEETRVPDRYKKIEGKIKIVLERDGNGYKVKSATKDSTVQDTEFKSNNVTVALKNQVTIKINNIKLVNLEGKVWLDGQKGAKDIEEANGRIEANEEGIDGVIVYLCDKYGNVVESQETANGGTYKFIDKPAGEYQIKFQYNGIWYEDVGKKQDSKAAETTSARTTFNNRFTTISPDQSNDGTKLAYTYNSEEKISTLNADVKGTNPATGNEDFKILAQTDVTNYKDDTQNINCGLIDRYFDLAIGTDVSEAEVSINGKTTKYNYKQIMDGDLDKISSSSDVVYNLYLYTSDYNYRIEDYKTDRTGIANKLNPTDASEIARGISLESELKIEITYKVILKNQSKHNAKVEEFVYHYDAENYKPLFNVGDTINGYKVKSIDDNKVTFEAEGENNTLSQENDYRKELDIPFEVKKGNVDKSDNYATNIAEITKYSAEGGLIDEDSAPGNGIVNNAITQYEDDTDEAKGINIKIAGDKIRTIKGTVWDDGAKKSADGADGKLDNSSEKTINDVIVQLIEVKKIGDNYYEYIWQETRSGSNKVKKLSSDGTQITEVEYSEEISDGEYLFTGFIPGNYIIRFIYGDGTTEDVKTYNGQDYQSTIDPKYKASWYNTAGYGDTQSVARDNEARRLEVMAYSTTINSDTKFDNLEKTWMCAETSRINVPVDADNKNTEDSETSSTDSSKSLEFENINFGLALRPQTKLALEKHITSLKIVPTGAGSAPVVDARVNIKDVMDGKISEKITGVTDGLATIASARNNRGFWKVETDIEELAQGATLEIEYTYVIVNQSDEDYLKSELVNQYKTNSDNYSNYLNSLIPSLKDGIMRTGQYAYSDDNAIGGYLGEFYYTGVTGANDTKVLSRVNNLKESLNEQFGKQEKVSDYFKARDPEDKDVKAYLDREGNPAATPKNIVTVLESNNASKFLVGKSGDEYTENDTDWSKTAKITTVLSSVTNGEIGGSFPSYIAEITSYSNAAGRRNMEATPGNLTYVHSEDTTMTMNTHNELDEFWGESIIISKPTGQDKLTGLQIAIITTISVVILGAGIVLIKKYVLKK